MYRYAFLLSFVNVFFFTYLPGQRGHFKAVLWIRDILGRIRIWGSVALTNGSESCYFRQ
jgi:hypothetical protein